MKDLNSWKFIYIETSFTATFKEFNHYILILRILNNQYIEVKIPSFFVGLVGKYVKFFFTRIQTI